MSTTNSGWLAGLRDSLPIMVAAGPFGMVFGAVAGQAGLSVADAALMSAFVFAGASQMVAVDLFGQSVPAWAIVLSVFAVNFRHILYSAAVAPVMKRFPVMLRYVGFGFLIDPQYALVETRRERSEPVTIAWYFGLALPLYAVWIAVTAIGAAFGALIEEPAALGFDMVLPIYFMALVMGFRKRRNWLPVVLASSAVSIAVYLTPGLGSPWHVSLGGLAGVIAAALLTPSEPKAQDGSIRTSPVQA